ncbi:diguanylate cyclase YdeH [mine drainage metagenome]|uniref:Diguanylate cyclase YdeH n=1 Tax=mine drainage metagenome TaxID=410659 RepID=A0A1J5QHD6_9ZZZZ
MKTSTYEADVFVQGLDMAIATHMDWTRRVLRCAVLRTSPGDDVLRPQAHAICRFGLWFTKERALFDLLDPEAAQRIDCAHRAMHEATRALCVRVLAGQPGQAADLDTFETAQGDLLNLLARVKTLVLTTIARRDPLTGLPMRFGIEHEFAHCRKEATRCGERLYVVMIDIDRFKWVNDTYGHPVGDTALRQFAAALKSSVREDEPLYRFGGEEFLALLRCSTPDCQHKASERILDVIRSSPVEVDPGLTLNLTATLGVASVGDQEDLASAIERADAALYEGKRAGRNRFVVAPDLFGMTG